jgi:hypothetical protein
MPQPSSGELHQAILPPGVDARCRHRDERLTGLPGRCRRRSRRSWSRAVMVGLTNLTSSRRRSWLAASPGSHPRSPPARIARHRPRARHPEGARLDPDLHGATSSAQRTTPTRSTTNSDRIVPSAGRSWRPASGRPSRARSCGRRTRGFRQRPHPVGAEVLWAVPDTVPDGRRDRSGPFSPRAREPESAIRPSSHQPPARAALTAS